MLAESMSTTKAISDTVIALGFMVFVAFVVWLVFRMYREDGNSHHKDEDNDRFSW